MGRLSSSIVPQRLAERFLPPWPRRWFPLRSIRVTMTCWYLALVALVLSLFGWTLLLELRSHLLSGVDSTLRAQAEAIPSAITAFWEAEKLSQSMAPGNWQNAPGPTLRDEIARGQLPEVISRWAERMTQHGQEEPVRLLAPSGEPLYVFSAFTTLVPPEMEAPVSGLPTLEERVAYQTLEGSQQRTRLITRPVRQDGRVSYLIQVASSLQGVDTTVRNFRGWMIGLVPLTLLLSSAVAWFLASVALRPVGRMIHQAQELSAEHLDQRIDVPKTGDELEQLALTFNDLLGRMERAFRRMRQFSSAASHELRTPLTIMRGEVDVALRKPRDIEEYQRVLRTLLATLTEMSFTVEQLLIFARSEPLGGAVDWRPVELGTLLRHVEETWHPLARAKGVTFEVAASDPVWVRGEGRLLERLVANLADNALKHTPRHGRVTIQVGQANGDSWLTVRDTGPGISSDMLPHLFENFFQRRDPAESKQSVGLGLALCRWIAEVHHGRIEVASPPGQGATFTVWLPLTAPPT